MSGRRSVLSGGQLRRGRGPRRGRAMLAVVVLALAGLGLAAARPGGDDSPRHRRPAHRAVLAPPPRAEAAPRPPVVYARRWGPAAQRVHPRFKRPPGAGLLWDLRTGRVLWQRRPVARLRIASLTKMLTAILVADRLGPRRPVRITREALAYQGSGVGVLPRGKRVAVEPLLYGLLLPSGNDAAIALAQASDGTVARFVRRMNARARPLGLRCSRFSSPHGLRDRGNFACVRDLAVLAREVLRRPRLARIVRTRDVALPFPIKGGKLYLANNNALLRLRYPGTIGVKTGYTDASGRCLVAAVQSGRRRLGVVLLRSVDPPGQARRLFDLAFGRRR